MIYKNNPEKLKLAKKNYIIKKSLIFGFAILVNFILFYFVLPKIQPEFDNIKYIFLILFPCLACYCGFIVFLFCKKLKKNFLEYSFEIVDNEIKIYENGKLRNYKIIDIQKIEMIRENLYVIYMKNHNRFYTSEFLENIEDFICDISKIKKIEKSSFYKTLSILSWIFCIGFFISRFIKNIYIYVFFALGFLITSIINVYQIINSPIKLWAKIYTVCVHSFIDSFIVYVLYKIFVRIFA